jgi:hypothetical protein
MEMIWGSRLPKLNTPNHLSATSLFFNSFTQSLNYNWDLQSTFCCAKCPSWGWETWEVSLSSSPYLTVEHWSSGGTQGKNSQKKEERFTSPDSSASQLCLKLPNKSHRCQPQPQLVKYAEAGFRKEVDFGDSGFPRVMAPVESEFSLAFKKCHHAARASVLECNFSPRARCICSANLSQLPYFYKRYQTRDSRPGSHLWLCVLPTSLNPLLRCHCHSSFWVSLPGVFSSLVTILTAVTPNIILITVVMLLVQAPQI